MTDILDWQLRHHFSEGVLILWMQQGEFVEENALVWQDGDDIVMPLGRRGKDLRSTFFFLLFASSSSSTTSSLHTKLSLQSDIPRSLSLFKLADKLNQTFWTSSPFPEKEQQEDLTDFLMNH